MAMKQWATYSVADHVDLHSIVPDVLLFDCLVFPYPAGEKEEARWIKNDWKPELLDFLVSMLGEYARLVEWGEKQDDEFKTNMRQAELVEQLLISPMSWGMSGNDPKTKWERAKQMTRCMVRNVMNGERGKDVWIMPRYGSPDGFFEDQALGLSDDRKARKKALALLVGQKMALPHHADAKVALRLAVDLARDNEYRKARDALSHWQESVIAREQPKEADAQELADLISDLNRHVEKSTAEKRSQWMFFALKRLLGAHDLINPSRIPGVVLETTQFLTKQRNEIAPGPMAAFHHVREKVIAPSMAGR
jgi:hypothetical protein